MFELMQINYLLVFATAYAVALFFLASKTERISFQVRRWYSPAVYSLSLAVYCTSWTFFGAVGMAANSGWSFFAIYLGPILLFLFGWSFLRRLMVFSNRNKVTSIADFIGSRFGKRQTLASLVTLVALAGTLPYIALQLRAVSLAWAAIDTPAGEIIRVGSGTSFVTAIVMALFAIMFGTRVVEGQNRMKGLMSAIAVESIVKLFAFCFVGVMAWRLLSNPTTEIANYFTTTEKLPTQTFITQTLIAMTAIVCLPRQFHVMVVEPHSLKDARIARWMFPLYLMVFSVMVLPIAVAGSQIFSATEVSPDLYVLQLPMFLSEDLITALAFIGGLSAATGMVIVASVTLSIMVSNEIVVPIFINLGRRGITPSKWAGDLRAVRRITIVLVLLLAWWVDSTLQQPGGLASMGLISFAAAAQFMPAIVAGLYWQNAHRNGVLWGMLVGVALWFYTLLLPALLGSGSDLVINGPFGQSYLSPYSFLGLTELDALTRGVILSLSANIFVMWLVSRRSRFNNLDLRQAEAFTKLNSRLDYKQQDFELTVIEGRQLLSILDPLIGETRTGNLWSEFEQRLGHRLLPHDKVPRFVVYEIENQLARIIGAVSAHRVIDLMRRQEPMALEDFVAFVGGTESIARFSQDLLQTTLENIPQGISVVDKTQQLVAWNKQYEKMFNFPPRLLYVGCPIERVYKFNALRGYLGKEQDDVETLVKKRLDLLKIGEPYRIERALPNGRVIEIRGTPLGDGGYVTTYNDITDFYEVLAELESSKQSLEERVEDRTRELSEANQSMQQENQLRARLERELNDAYTSKTQFLAAASHDLLQPINAARLFVSALQSRDAVKSNDELKQEISHIDQALNGAESLISSLREIARLDSGKMTAQRSHFLLSDLLTTLAREAGLFTSRKGISLRTRFSEHWVFTDEVLLRRIVQNFLSNAVRYTTKGGVLLACRARKDRIVVQVWDTGVGIPEKDVDRIFNEFERLSDTRSVDGQKGLGLGLSITRRISQILGHQLHVKSVYGKGSVFSIEIPVGKKQHTHAPVKRTLSDLKGVSVLCVDNEVQITQGMRALMEQWGCHVVTATDLKSAIANWKSSDAPDIIVADYHLDDDELGVTLIDTLRLRWGAGVPAIIISADDSAAVKSEVQNRNIQYLSKPVPAAGLRSVMRGMIRKRKQDAN